MPRVVSALMWFMSCLGGIHDIYWIITHYLSRSCTSSSDCPSQGGLSSLRRCCQWGGREGQLWGSCWELGSLSSPEDLGGTHWSLSKEGFLLWLLGHLGFFLSFTSYDLKCVYSQAISITQMDLRFWWNYLMTVWGNARNTVSGVNRELEPGVFQHQN